MSTAPDAPNSSDLTKSDAGADSVHDLHRQHMAQMNDAVDDLRRHAAGGADEERDTVQGMLDVL